MSVFSNRVTTEEARRFSDITAKYTTGIRGQEPKQWMIDPGRGEFYGDSFDLAMRQASNPFAVNTTALGEQQVVASSANDAMYNGMIGSNISGITNPNLRLERQNVWMSQLSSLFPEMDPSVIKAYGDRIWSKENAAREAGDLHKSVGPFVFPGMVSTGETAGEDDNLIVGTETARRSYGRMARMMALERTGLSNQEFNRLEAAEGPNEAKAAMVESLAALAFTSKDRAKAALNSDEDYANMIEAAKESTTISQDDLDRFDSSVFPDIVREANDRGLTGNMMATYVYDQAQQRITAKLIQMFNNPEAVDNPVSVMEQVTVLAETVGPDFVDEAIFNVRQRGDWADKAWDSLPESRRGALEAAGHTKETFLRDKDGEILPHISNSYVYANNAMLTAQNFAATNTREEVFRQGWHDGFANWTRRLSDMAQVDVYNDPLAMYFLTPAVAGGVAAGLAFSSGAAGSTALGRVMSMTAVDGLTAGMAEGYAVSVAGQSQAYMSGLHEQISFDATINNMLLYGGLGALGGAAIAGTIGGIGPALRGSSQFISGIGNTVSNIADDIAATGVVGETAMLRALNRLAEREATVAEIEGAQIFSHIQNTGLVVRLNRGEVEAKEVLAEVIPGMVVREEGRHAVSVDDLFSSQSLADNGLSPAAAVNLVYGIQRMLGPGGQIATEEFDMIVKAAFRAAREHAATVGGDLYDDAGKLLVDTTAARIRHIDSALKSDGIELAENFIGGSGRTVLTDAESAEFRTLVQRLKDGTITDKMLGKLVNQTTRLNDERIMNQVRKLINERGNLSVEDLGKFNRQINETIANGRLTREDKFLQDALKVERALSLLQNESTIRAARELGVSADRVMRYIQKFKSVVGDEAAVTALNREMPDMRNAVLQIAEGKGMEVLDSVPPAFNTNRFLRESDAVANARELQSLRKRLRKQAQKAAKIAETKGNEKVADRLAKVANRTAERYRELQRKLGIDMEVEEAYEAVLNRIKQDIPFSKRTSTERELLLSDAVDKLILRSSPDAVEVGEINRDRAWFSSMFKETALGRRMERLIASASLWPQAQNRLFRSRIRLVRGVSNWITGQHVSNRVFSNSTDFLSIESIVEGSAREALPFMQVSKGIRGKLGGAHYRLFDTDFLRLRQMNKLIGKPSEYQLDGVSEALIRAYDSLGGEEALRADLHAAQRAYTSFMAMAIEEAEEAGFPLVGMSATRYVPNHIRGNLTKERANQFVQGFLQVRRKQLLEGGAHLDLEVLHSMGWIRLTKGAEVDARGRTLSNKKFVIPEDSPFYISPDLDTNLQYAQAIIKKGYPGLTELDPKTGVPAVGRAGALSGGVEQEIDKAIKYLQDPSSTKDLLRGYDDVAEILGDDFNSPTGRSSAEAGRDMLAAKGVAGLDEELAALENASNFFARASDDVIEAFEAETGLEAEIIKEDLESAMALRRKAIMQSVRERTADTKPRVRRKPMTANQRVKLVNDKAAYSNLSEGHAALVSRLDAIMADGMLDEAGARVVMAAFADIDPHKLAGMSFVRMDALTDIRYGGEMAEALDVVSGERITDAGIVRLRSILERQAAGLEDNSIHLAATLVHETSHITFLSASPRLQGTIQAIYNQVRNAESSEFHELFRRFGIDVDYAMGSVHEFMAHLAEISLVRNKYFTPETSSAMKTLIQRIGQFFRQLFGEIAVVNDGFETIAEQILGKEQWQAVNTAVRSTYDLIPTDDPAIRLQQVFGIAEDPFEREVTMVGIGTLGRAGNRSSLENELRSLRAKETSLAVALNAEKIKKSPNPDRLSDLSKQLAEVESRISRTIEAQEQLKTDAIAQKVNREIAESNARQAARREEGQEFTLKVRADNNRNYTLIMEAKTREEAIQQWQDLNPDLSISSVQFRKADGSGWEEPLRPADQPKESPATKVVEPEAPAPKAPGPNLDSLKRELRQASGLYEMVKRAGLTDAESAELDNLTRVTPDELNEEQVSRMIELQGKRDPKAAAELERLDREMERLDNLIEEAREKLVVEAPAPKAPELEFVAKPAESMEDRIFQNQVLHLSNKIGDAQTLKTKLTQSLERRLNNIDGFRLSEYERLLSKTSLSPEETKRLAAIEEFDISPKVYKEIQDLRKNIAFHQNRIDEAQTELEKLTKAGEKPEAPAPKAPELEFVAKADRVPAPKDAAEASRMMPDAIERITLRFMEGKDFAKATAELETFTDLVYNKIFANGWPTDDSGKFLSEENIFAMATNKKNLGSADKTRKSRGAGGDRKGRGRVKRTKEEVARMNELKALRDRGDLTADEQAELLNLEKGRALVTSMTTAEGEQVDVAAREAVEISVMRQELNELSEAGLRSSDREVVRSAKKLTDSQTLALEMERRNLPPGERGGYELTEADIEDISKATGLSKSAVRNHNKKYYSKNTPGLLNAENLAEWADTIRAGTTEENRAAAKVRLETERATRQAQELEESILDSPQVQKAVSETSAGNTKETSVEAATKARRARTKDKPVDQAVKEEAALKVTNDDVDQDVIDQAVELIGPQEMVGPMPMAGDIAEIPGYTRLTREELDAKVDKHDNVFAFLADDVQQTQAGEGASYRLWELAEYFNARKAAQAAGEPEAPVGRMPEPISDAELKARWDKDAKARAEAEGQGLGPQITAERAFEGTKGPAPRPAADLTDDELINIGSNLEAKLARDGELTRQERNLYNEINREIRGRTSGEGGGGAKPPRTAVGAAGEAPEPRKFLDGIEEYFDKRSAARVERGSFHAGHRLSGTGRSLAELYSDAVNGDTSILSEAYKRSQRDNGLEVVSALERVGRDYIEHAGGRFKTTFDSSVQSLDEHISILGNINNLHSRTFNEFDLDTPGGEELAKLFAEATSSTEGIMRYADTTLGTIRLQKALNELVGEKGATMGDIFQQVQSSLEKNLMREDSGRMRSLMARDVQEEVQDYMIQLKELYLRARGFNPRKDQSFAQSSRIAQNLAYSMLGAKFAMSVLFVETPLAVLRTSGLNPLKMVHNTGIILGAYLNAARGAAVQYKPLQKFMSALGMDNRIVQESVDDMIHSISNLRSSSMSRFGAGGEGMEEGRLMFTLKDRLQAHLENIAAAGGRDTVSDTNMLRSLMNYLEAGTAMTADLTGMMSFMHPVTNSVREVAANQGKATLFKHSPALLQLAKRIGEAGEVTTDQIVGMARELGIPKALAVYAAEAGLLRRDGAILQRLMALGKLTPTSAGRELNMNSLSLVIDAERSRLLQNTMGGELQTAGRLQADIDAQILPSLNQFLMYVTNEESPELRGTMRFQGMNPLTDLLFQMLSYPMAAYQALVGNGVTARGPMMTAGILAVLTGLEYFNRNAQRAMLGKDEEDRQKALEKLTRIPTSDDIVEVLAMYGTSSPMFGAVGSYLRDIVGNPILRAAGHQERNFPTTPFRSPAMAMMQKIYGQMSKAAGSAGTAYREGDASKMGTALGNVLETGYEISPLNALPLGQAYQGIRNLSLTDAWKGAHVAMTKGSATNVPGFSYPPIEDSFFYKWHNADTSPSSRNGVVMPPLPQDPAPRQTAPQAPAPAPQAPAGSGSTSPSSGLADRL